MVTSQCRPPSVDYACGTSEYTVPPSVHCGTTSAATMQAGMVHLQVETAPVQDAMPGVGAGAGAGGAARRSDPFIHAAQPKPSEDWPSLPRSGSSPQDDVSPTASHTNARGLPSYDPLQDVGMQGRHHGRRQLSPNTGITSDQTSIVSGETGTTGLDGEWPTVSAMVTTGQLGSPHCLVEELPARLQPLTLVIERRVRARILKVSHKGQVLQSDQQWREAVQTFWVNTGRRARARLVAFMRSVATGLRKRRAARHRQAALQLWELAQRSQLRKELLEFVGINNIMSLLGRTHVRSRWVVLRAAAMPAPTHGRTCVAPDCCVPVPGR